MHAFHLKTSLIQVQSIFYDLGYSWALVGGLAVSARCEPRFTNDLDLAISVASDEQAESLTFKLIKRGASLEFTLDQDEQKRLSMVSLKLDQTSHTSIDLLFASSGIEAEITQSAELLEVFPHIIIPVASLSHLAALKLLSVSIKRMKDLSDLNVLKEAMNRQELEQALEACRLITSRGYNRGFDLEARYQRWVEGKLPITD